MTTPKQEPPAPADGRRRKKARTIPLRRPPVQSHYIQMDRADLLKREVPVFIEEIRENRLSPKNGTTETE